MATLGAPSITFPAGTVYCASNGDCIQVASFTNGKEDITYRCGGDYAHLAGTSSIMLDFSLALSAADTAIVTALAPGATGIAEYHPFGDVAGRIEHDTTKATIVKADLSDAAGKVVTLDISMVWDNVTSTAAT
jgi:hypothetical protein